MSALLPQAVLWDMDGTLVDTEPYWLEAEQQLVESFGGVWTREHGMMLVGSALERSAQILQSAGVLLPTGEIVDTLSGAVTRRLSNEVPWRPGARELLAELRKAGIRTALVTMSLGTMARTVADSLGFVGFDAVVAGDDVVNGKPHPEAYLTAAELLGVEIAECVAIEDSLPGSASAVAAGATVIAVPAHVPLPPSADYTLWDTLAGRSVDDLARVLARRVEGVA